MAEFDFVISGDRTQADHVFAAEALALEDGRVVAAFIHDVGEAPRREAPGLFYNETVLGHALDALDGGWIGQDALVRVRDAVASGRDAGVYPPELEASVSRDLARVDAVGSTSVRFLTAINRACVPSAEMKFTDIALGDSETSVETRLGAPKTRTGAGPAAVLQYPGLRIRLHASRVQSLLATSPKWLTPSGIRAGLSPTRVSEILGFDLDAIESPNSKSPRGYLVHRCIESMEQMDAEHYLRLELSHDRSIAEVEIFWVAP